MNSNADLAPSDWDSALNTTDRPAELMERFSDLGSEVAARRYLMSAVATCDPTTISAALSRVEDAYPTKAWGARMLALGQLRQPEAIQAIPMCMPGPDPLALEDACDQAMALGMSARSLRQFESAHSHLSVALFLARTLGMRHREQHVMLELAQVLTIQGRPCPEMIEEALAMPIPTTTRRRDYGAEALAEACMALGDYRRALQLSASRSGPHLGLWAFAGALLGDESTRGGNTHDDSYTALATAVWAMREGSGIAMPNLTPNSPEAEYGALLRSVAMLQSRPMLRQARRALEGLKPLTPDQRVWQLAGMIHVSAMAAGEDHVRDMMLEFAEALNALRTREYILPLLRGLMPETYMLLGLLPGAHPDVEDSLTELPILTGMCLTYQYRVHKLPGKASGSAVLVRSIALNSQERIHRQARERVREALAALAPSPALNLGVALRAVSMLGRGAQAGERAEWQAALNRALDWVDSDVLRSDLRPALQIEDAKRL